MSIPSSVAATPASLAQLHQLLDAGMALSSTYRGRLSNHLPMAQQALLALGASAERLQQFTDAQRAVLPPQTPALDTPPAGPQDLGRPERDAAWRAHFASRMATLGAAEALREALALLLPGAGAIAFHGLIRSAHAAQAGHEGELAAGLAHWAAHFMPLPVQGQGPALELPDWVQALRALPVPSTPPAGLIADRMWAWGAVPGFAGVAGLLQRGPEALRELALLAARSYAASANFTVLHLLTASHAMAVLQPWWPTPELPPGFAAAAAAGLLASGAEPVWTAVSAPRRPWSALIQAACAQDDAHVIKLTHAAWALDQRWPAPAWRAAVERAIPV